MSDGITDTASGRRLYETKQTKRIDALQRAIDIVRAVEWEGDLRVNMTTVIGAGRVLAKWIEDIEAAIDGGGLDVSPCRGCSRSIVCLPDGLPMCESCATEST